MTATLEDTRVSFTLATLGSDKETTIEVPHGTTVKAAVQQSLSAAGADPAAADTLSFVSDTGTVTPDTPITEETVVTAAHNASNG